MDMHARALAAAQDQLGLVRDAAEGAAPSRGRVDGEGAMTARPIPSVPSWSLRIECDRCGQERMISETHIPVPAVTLLRDILDRMRHDGCGGRAGKVELLTGIEGGSSRPVRRIVLPEG